MVLTVAIDAIAMSHPQAGGYKTYTTQLVRALSQLPDEATYHLFFDRPPEEHFSANCHVYVLPAPGGGLQTAWREQVALPRRLPRASEALLHSPCATGPLSCPLPTVVTVHDVIEFTDPLPPAVNTKRWAMRVYSRFIQTHAVRRAVAVITDSDCSRTRVADRMKIAAHAVSVIPLAPSPAFRLIERSLALSEAKRICGSSDFVLAIAASSPRKNSKAVLRAYARLSAHLRSRHPLVMVCSHQDVAVLLRREATILGIESQTRFVSRLSDGDLRSLYNAASLFVFPSLDEGFGLPPLEAMACGAPVVSSQAASMPEVLGDAALLVEATNTELLAHAMEQVLSDKQLATSLVDRGFAQCRRYSWIDTANQTLGIYRKVAQRVPASPTE